MPVKLSALISAAMDVGVIVLIVIGAVVAVGGLLFAVFMTTEGKKKAKTARAEAESEQQAEQPVEEAAEEAREEVQEEQPVEEVAEETREEVQEEQPVEEVAEEVREEAQEEQPVEEAAEETREEAQEEQPVEEVAEETREEVQEEQPVEEAAEETREEVQEEQPVEEVAEETREEVQEEQPVEEVAEEVREEIQEEQPIEEVAEEVLEEVQEEQPVEEPVSAVESERVIASVLDDEEEDDEKDEREEEVTVRKPVGEGEDVRYIVIKYKKSFTAKLIQNDDVAKNYYSELKNELLSYKGVKARMSWKGETFYSGRKTYAKLSIRSKNIGLYLALDPKKYAETKYAVDDMSEVATHAKVPCRYIIKNGRRLKYSKDLIAEAMGDRPKDEKFSPENWAEKYPYEPLEPLIERNLVKVLTDEEASSGTAFKPRDFVEANEVDEIMQDEVAVALIEETEEISDKTKCTIINIDTLSRYFEDGETVTLKEIKKRVPKFPARTTYIKVLARGALNKKLNVIADSYSIQAAKMILITGGTAVKKKNP